MPRVKKRRQSRYALHRAKWRECEACCLQRWRTQVVLARGQLPCGVLFAGEAPGASEDDLGTPFVGPAGHLLDNIVETAIGSLSLRWAFTNLVACIPKYDKNEKVGAPKGREIKSCSVRLAEFLEIAQPKLVVAVGSLANTWLPKVLPPWCNIGLHIEHPASILRIEDARKKKLAKKRCIVDITRAIVEMEE